MAEIGWADMKTGKGRSFPPSPILPFLFFFFFPVVAHACPMCTELLEHGRDALQALMFGRGIAWSILLMLSVPFLLVGGTIFSLVRAQHRISKNKFPEHDRKS